MGFDTMIENIRKARGEEVVSGLIPCWVNYDEKAIVIAAFTDHLANMFGFPSAYDAFLKSVIPHETMHLLLDKLEGRETARAFDRLKPNPKPHRAEAK